MESIEEIADRLWMDRESNGWDECLKLAITDPGFQHLIAKSWTEDFENLIKAMDMCPTGGSVEVHKGGRTFAALHDLLKPRQPRFNPEAE